MNNRKFSGRNLHHRDDHPSSIQQISHDLTLDSHRTRLLERLLLSRSRSQRHFGVDRESSILLSGLSTAVSASEVATTTSAEPEFSVKSSQISRPKLTQSQHHQPPSTNSSFNIELLLQQAREKIIHSEATKECPAGKNKLTWEKWNYVLKSISRNFFYLLCI